MKKVYILALHLSYGGVERVICSMANLFARDYDVEILSVYNISGKPFYELDSRVKVTYLTDVKPNRAEWKKAAADKNIPALIRESFRAVKVLAEKKSARVRAIKAINEGIIIATRPEDGVLLSRYGSPSCLKIAQLHQDHMFDETILRQITRQSENIDIYSFLTPGLAAEMRGRMIHSPDTKVICVPNFLRRYPELPPADTRAKTVLAVGRLEPVKRFDLIIRIFAEIKDAAPEWKLRIVGEGSERAKLESLIDELGLSDRVTLTGMLDGESVEKEMLSASIITMQSAFEGFGMVLLEGFSCAMPAVAFDVRVGPAAIISDGTDGYLIPEGDMKLFTEKLLFLMQHDEARIKMAAKAVEKSHKFSEENLRAVWYDVLENRVEGI